MIIEFLYPSLGNLYGEEMQFRLIQKCFPDAHIVRTELRDIPTFSHSHVDLALLGPLSEKSQEKVIQALQPYRDRLISFIESGAGFLATGNALEVFGEYIVNEDGSRIRGVGIFPTYAQRDMMHRYNSLYLGEYHDLKIVGYKAQFSHSYGDIGEGNNCAFHTIRGDGLHPGYVGEGITHKNFLGTYLLGPLLITNPLFAKRWLGEVTGRKIHLPYEKDMIAAYERRLAELSRADIKFN